MVYPKHIDKQTADGTAQNLEALYKLFPSCFTESADVLGNVKRAINWGKLRELLGDNIADGEPEVYDFTWVGKRAAQREAMNPCRKTLRPCPEESVNWDTTQNLYIEGDNLEVLKLLQNSYMGKVKMIYIDPPYNTGKDFLYMDKRNMSIDEYNEMISDEEGRRLIKNTFSNGSFHSVWCSEIYKVLLIARSFLSDDGVIFISIDDNEQNNLKNICDEVFGEANWLITIAVNRTSEVATDKTIQKHEYCLTYAKSINELGMCGKKQYTISRGTVGNVDQTMPEITFPKGLKCINIEEGVYHSSRQIEGSRENIEVLSPFIVKDGKLAEDVVLKARWRSSNDMRNFFANKCKPTQAKINGIIEEIYFDGDRFMPYIKKLVTEKIPSLFLENRRGSTDLESLGLNYFDFPKSVHTISRFISLVTSADDIVMDFYSGSSTTAHAVMKLNAEDEQHRQFVMVQLPEETVEDSDARKDGYNTICSIAKERIRRAGKKIKEENPEAKDLDIGFRVFKCDESNYKNVAFTPSDYSQESLELFVDNIKEDRTDLDLLFDCMLRWGITLDLPMTSTKVDGCKIHNVNEGALVACFEGRVTEKVIDAICAMEPNKVVFRDSSFEEAAQKMNLFELFKQKLGWEEQEVRNNIRVI
jgi:adenine-specific DNA-methyltransferase